MATTVKRVLVGRPISNEKSDHTLLPKWLALPVFGSDALSSVAYATESMLLVLVLGGTAALAMTPWIGAAVAVLLIIVVTSYRKTAYAYPGGGGAYAVAKDNFGDKTALVAAAALMIDYILTVAVSTAAGVANLASAFPSLGKYTVWICVGIIVLMTVANLRGIKESGTLFSIPTYGFIASVFLMLGVAVYHYFFGSQLLANSHALPVDTKALTGGAAVFLILRAFASGCTALTGVEAISNGVPYFRKPKSHNAGLTLVALGGIAVTMFIGVTLFAMWSQAKIAPPEDLGALGLPPGAQQMTIIAQLSEAAFGKGSAMFYVFQLFTALVLILAANTGYNSFPILAAVLGRDGFLPRQFGRRGDRFVFSNGIVVLSLVAIALIVAFDANVERLIQLYILGVFLSFTISQSGMVRHWNKILPTSTGSEKSAILRSRVVNTIGAIVTALVLVIVVTTKFMHGAWIVVVAIPIFFSFMLFIKRHYEGTDRRLAARPGGVVLPSRVHAVVLVSRLHAPAMQAVAYARATRPSTLVALHVDVNSEETEALIENWQNREIPVPLTIMGSPYRDLTRPVLEYVAEVRLDSPRDLISVFVPEYVVRKWWEQLLHNQSALRLKARLLFMPNVIVVSVPLLLTDETDVALAVTPGRALSDEI